MIPMAGYPSPEVPLIRHIASPDESLEHPLQGDLSIRTHSLPLLTYPWRRKLADDND